MKFETLDAWLHHIEGLHAQTIDLGLDRMETMLKRLDIRFKCPVFTVGGTNGKGSTCAFIESALLAGGYSVGVHTSPHLIHFNERVRINGEDAKDEELIRQFEKVEAAREDMTLSYFEYTLLGIQASVLITRLTLGRLANPSVGKKHTSIVRVSRQFAQMPILR